MKKKKFMVPAEGMFGPVYVDDLIKGIYMALTKPAASGQIFQLSGFGEVSNLEYFGYLAKMVGLKKVPGLSSKLAITGSTVFEKAVHLAGKTTDINPLSMIMLSRPSADYSHAKAKKLLGYMPTVTLGKGMQRCEVWLRKQDVIK